MLCPIAVFMGQLGGGLALGGNHTPWVPIVLGGGMGGTRPPATLAQDFYCPPKVSEMRAPPPCPAPGEPASCPSLGALAVPQLKGSRQPPGSQASRIDQPPSSIPGGLVSLLGFLFAASQVAFPLEGSAFSQLQPKGLDQLCTLGWGWGVVQQMLPGCF